MTNEAQEAAVMPRQVRAAQVLLYILAFTGLVVVLARSEGATSYGLGLLMGAWICVWGSALLALTYDGSARGGVRTATLVLLVLALVSSLGQVREAATPGEFLDAALRLALGLPAVVLLLLPESGAWFTRGR
ncbi:hypothetical protein AB0K80_18035 [Streptomyces sp. NPDC052682]|uniref:hypothetical protein n=1 Tax=Streptomyces sp. NPDC052682 TaxID=3154954 RepID=UPI0034444C2C